jgi:hypothetical protein
VRKMKFIVPAGIGDFSWAWSKFYSMRHRIERIDPLEGWPNRTAPYIELCGMPSCYVEHTYQSIILAEALDPVKTWADIEALERDTIMIEANEFLGTGKRLEDWLPDLPTEHHYPLHTTADDEARAERFLRGMPRPLVGISAASYRGSEAWSTWNRLQWTEALKAIIAHGWNPVLLGGGWDDLTYSLAETLSLPDLVGKTSIAEAVCVQRKLDSYIGFSSGLGVIRTVLNKPAFMLWPDPQWPLSTAWPPLDMILNRRYVASLWHSVPDVLSIMLPFLDRCLEERHQHPLTVEAKEMTLQ